MTAPFGLFTEPQDDGSINRPESYAGSHAPRQGLRRPGLLARPRAGGRLRALDPARAARLLLRRAPVHRPAGPPRHLAGRAERPARRPGGLRPAGPPRV